MNALLKFVLAGLIASCTFNVSAAVVATQGSGSAVTTVTNAADFELNFGLISGYVEDGMIFVYTGSGDNNGCGYAGCTGHTGFSPGFSGNYFYSTGDPTYISIRMADDSDFSAIEFVAGTGFNPPIYGYWETYNNNVLTGSGNFAFANPDVLGLQDDAGFDEVRYFSFQGPGQSSGFAAPAIDTVRATQGASADLAVAVTSNSTAVRVGQTALFGVGVSNTGPDASGSTTLVLTLDTQIASATATAPVGWTCGAAAVGGGQTMITCDTANIAASGGGIFNVSVPMANPQGGTTVNLLAVVDGASGDPVPGDNSDSASVAVTSSANLRLSFSGPTSAVRSGFPVPVFARLDNYGANAAAYPYVTVTINVPQSAVTLAAPAGWSCTAGPLTKSASTAKIASAPIPIMPVTAAFQCIYNASFFARGSVLFPIMITPIGYPVPTMVTFSGATASETVDPVPGNNEATFKLNVRAATAFIIVTPPIN